MSGGSQAIKIGGKGGKKIIALPGGQGRPLIRETQFSSVPPSKSLVLSWTLGGLFELTWRPSRALDSRVTNRTIQRYKNTAGCRGLRKLSRKTYANLDCVFVENALLFVVPNPMAPKLAPFLLSTSLLSI